MTNYNQILKLITVLSLSLHEIVGQTETCDQETADLGDIGAGSALAGLNVMDPDSGCTTVMKGDITVTCDLSVKDTLNQCLDKGGSHHLLHLEYVCNKLSLDAKNIPMCVGASCNIDDMTSTASAKEKMDKQIGDNISKYFSVDDKCGTKTFDVTKSTPATKNTSGESTNNDSNSDSNSDSNNKNTDTNTNTNTHTNTNNNNNNSSSLGNPSIHLNTLICFVFMAARLIVMTV